MPASIAGGESFANVRLTTERLTLREIEEDDWRSLLDYWSDPEVARYMPRGALNEEKVKGLVQRAVLGRRSHPRRYFRLAVVLKEGHQFVGDCVCRLVDPDNLEDLSRIIGQAHIGYYFGREFWGHGYATEVASALLAYGFETLGLQKLWAWCDTENLASVRVLEKIGMNREGHFRKSALIQGKRQDCFVYGLLKDEPHERPLGRGVVQGKETRPRRIDHPDKQQ